MSYIAQYVPHAPYQLLARVLGEREGMGKLMRRSSLVMNNHALIGRERQMTGQVDGVEHSISAGFRLT